MRESHLHLEWTHPPIVANENELLRHSELGLGWNGRWKLTMEEDAIRVPYVFYDREGGPLRKATKLAEGLGFHDLRHTSASILLKPGTHPKIVQERLGHSDIRTTLQTYSHVLQGLRRPLLRRSTDC